MEVKFPLCGNPAAEHMAGRYARRQAFPHALLIEGPSGSGKSTLARWLAAALLCRSEENRPCGACTSCHKADIQGHPDLLIYQSEKKTARSFHVDLVREARAQAFVRPNESDYKVLLLEDCETMTEQAQNALLKVLEEPPASAVFLLTCRNRAEMLETIRSRTACVTLELPGIAACAGALAERHPERTGVELCNIAEHALGSVGVALRLLAGETGEGQAHRDAAVTLLARLAAGDEYGALQALMPYEKDRQGLTGFLDALSALVSRQMLEGSYREGGGRIDRLQLYHIAAIIEDAKTAVRFNVGGLVLGSSLVARCMQVLTGRLRQVRSFE